MTFLEGAYAWLVRGARVASPAFSRGDSKLARGLRGRRGAAERLAEWAREHREPSRPLVWLHAPSVGEGLQARAVLEALLEARAGLQSVFTHFSPSAEGLAGRMPADIAGYLPWDVAGPVGTVLEAVRPSVVAFTKTEVWPVLSREAEARGIPTALVAATLPPGSSRLAFPARALLRPSLRRLSLVAAIAGDDAERFVDAGAHRDRVVVAGDPGIDSAAERAGAADPASPWLAPFHRDRRPTVVAGSTWPPDEAVLVAAMARVREAVPGVRLVVAPHEPDPGHLDPLEAALVADRWRVARLGAVEEAGDASGADAVVVDRVGVLAHLYTVGDAAFVGGGFHDAGLHSVLEPAAARLPVTFGPRHRNARAAGDLVERGGGRVVEGPGDLAETLVTWLGTDAGASAGESAFRYIGEHRGAARETARRLLDLVDG